MVAYLVFNHQAVFISLIGMSQRHLALVAPRNREGDDVCLRTGCFLSWEKWKGTRAGWQADDSSQSCVRVLTPGPVHVALFGKRAFAGVIKNLEIRGYLGGPKCGQMDPYIEGGRGKLDRRGKERRM